MRLRAVFFSCMALATLALGVAAAKPRAPAAQPKLRPAIVPRAVEGFDTARLARRSLRVWCGRPRTLRLVRYEDGSAGLRCAGRVLVRVSVPG